MKVSVLQDRLAAALKVCSKIITKSHWEVAGKIKLEAKDARLHVTVTNLNETTISMVVGAKIDVEGVAIVPAKTLIDSVASMAPERLDMAFEPRTASLNLRCGNTVTNIKGFLPEEFPQVGIEGDTDLLIEGKYLLEAIQHTLFAVHSERAPLSGVNFNVSEGTVGITALDGFRVAHTDLDCSNFTHLEENFTVPVQTIEVIASVLGPNPQVEVMVSRVNNHVLFTIGDTAVYGLLLDGNYPEWQNIVPTDIPTVARIHGAELELACKRVRVMTTQLDKTVNVVMEKEGITLFCRESELGDASDTFMPQEFKGERAEFKISVAYLAAPPLHGLIELGYAGPKKPIVLSAERWLYIVMPLSSNQGT